jgi:hypothetical protein
MNIEARRGRQRLTERELLLGISELSSDLKLKGVCMDIHLDSTIQVHIKFASRNENPQELHCSRRRSIVRCRGSTHFVEEDQTMEIFSQGISELQ